MAGFITKYKMGTLARTDLSKVSLNNQYQVNISGIAEEMKDYIKDYYVLPNNYATGSSIGLMCAEAVLPTSSFATAEVKDNFQGITQQFAHTRIYIDSEFTFYVDNDYNVMKFFEGWMDYISGSDNDPVNDIERSDNDNYFRRFNYPMNSNNRIGYKCGVLSISKFEKNVDYSLDYQFINAFPKGILTVPVGYGDADLLRVTVQFAYDRYIVQ